MSTYPNLNIEPEFSKTKTRNDENKNLKYQTEKHVYEYTLKSFRIDIEFYRKKHKSLN